MNFPRRGEERREGQGCPPPPLGRSLAGGPVTHGSPHGSRCALLCCVVMLEQVPVNPSPLRARPRPLCQPRVLEGLRKGQNRRQRSSLLHSWCEVSTRPSTRLAPAVTSGRPQPPPARLGGAREPLGPGGDRGAAPWCLEVPSWTLSLSLGEAVFSLLSASLPLGGPFYTF